MESVEYYVRGLFRGVEETPEIAEQREELAAHIEDHIADGKARGLTPEDAFREAVATLGNLDELIGTITKEKRRVLINRLNLLVRSIVLAYATAYMAATGAWLAGKDFGWRSIWIALLGLAGYAVPALSALRAFIRNPEAVAVVDRNGGRPTREALLGWLAISAGCGLVNLAFAGTDLFLHVFWSWIAVAGVFAWPLRYMVQGALVRYGASLEPRDA